MFEGMVPVYKALTQLFVSFCLLLLLSVGAYRRSYASAVSECFSQSLLSSLEPIAVLATLILHHYAKFFNAVDGSVYRKLFMAQLPRYQLQKF